jgi:hypothetical protein
MDGDFLLVDHDYLDKLIVTLAKKKINYNTRISSYFKLISNKLIPIYSNEFSLLKVLSNNKCNNLKFN